MQYRDSSNTCFAGFAVRFAALLVDSFLVGLALLFIRLPYFISAWLHPDNIFAIPVLFRFTAFDIFIYLLGKLYFVLTIYYTGTTLGKKLFNVKVVMADGSRLTFINVLYRETIGKYLSGVILMIGYLMAAIDEEKRTLHDRLCDTREIYSFKAPYVLKTNPEDRNADMIM